MEGKTKVDFVALAVVGDTEMPISPCGACRQVLSELFPLDAPIYLANLLGDIRETSIEELLPFAFDSSDL
jgi:cytidine deaminase